MWEILELAQNAAIEAELVREKCKQLCSHSEEETIRMKQDIAKNLEFRVDHERFWVKEVEDRVAKVKGVREELVEAKIRLQRSIDKCVRGAKVTDKSLLAFSESPSSGDDHLLKEELKLFGGTTDVLRSVVGAVIEIDKSLEDVCTMLEVDLQNKYVALNKDQQSLALKLHSPQLPSLVTSPASGSLCSSSSQKIDLETRNQTKLQQADHQVSSCQLFLSQMEEVLSKLTEKLLSHVVKVNCSLRERLNDLKKSKSDLENHLYLVDSHASSTEETITQLRKSISEKQNANLLVQAQLQLHRTRPKSELRWDQVQMTLERELADSSRELTVLTAQLPVMEKTLRSLRRSRLQIVENISEHTKKVQIEELHCLNARSELEEIRL